MGGGLAGAADGVRWEGLGGRSPDILEKKGYIPAVIQGDFLPNQHIALDAKSLYALRRRRGFKTRMIALRMGDGEVIQCLPESLQETLDDGHMCARGLERAASNARRLAAPPAPPARPRRRRRPRAPRRRHPRAAPPPPPPPRAAAPRAPPSDARDARRAFSLHLRRWPRDPLRNSMKVKLPLDIFNEEFAEGVRRGGYVHNMFAHHGLRCLVTQIDFPWALRVDMSKADEDGDAPRAARVPAGRHADGDQPRPPDRRLPPSRE